MTRTRQAADAFKKFLQQVVETIEDPTRLREPYEIEALTAYLFGAIKAVCAKYDLGPDVVSGMAFDVLVTGFSFSIEAAEGAVEQLIQGSLGQKGPLDAIAFRGATGFNIWHANAADYDKDDFNKILAVLR